MILTVKPIIGEQSFLIDDVYKKVIMPALINVSNQIDNDIRTCIKQEIKEHGSIVKRYGDWAKFITKEIEIVRYLADTKHLFHKTLLYRGKYIRDYYIKFEDTICSSSS